MVSAFALSIRKACASMKLSRSLYRYQTQKQPDDEVITVLLSVVERYPRYGFRKVFIKIRELGHAWNHKRVHRVYCLLKLNIRRKGKKRLPNRNPEKLSVPMYINQSWSIDFMSDSLMTGKRFRTFNVVDDHNREALAIEVDFSLPAVRVVRVLDRIAQYRGYPEQIRMDNGPEFISVIVADWAELHNIKLEFIQPGKPTQNSFVERFNRTFREEVLDFYLFRSLDDVRNIAENWMIEYNEERPHESLNDMTPVAYRNNHQPLGNSNYGWA
jgi:putative transposase